MALVSQQVLRTGRGFIVGAALIALAACGDILSDASTQPANKFADGKAQVGLLLPLGAQDPNVARLAASAESAARLAVQDTNASVQIDLRVYDTAGLPEQAALQAQLAAQEGADIIVGPLFAEAANAAGRAVAAQGINVLTLSNNTDIAGDNVYVLGTTFETISKRLVQYATARGKSRALIVHPQTRAGELGRDALVAALSEVGTAPIGIKSFAFDQQGVIVGVRLVADSVERNPPDLLLMTSNHSGALSLLAQLLPEAGVNPAVIQYAGTTRWDASPAAYNLKGIQGGWFVLPDPLRVAGFEARYEAAYGKRPHPLAPIAYDGIAAVAASIATGQPDPLGPTGLTRPEGFQGALGAFRLLPGGRIERALSVATIKGNEVIVIDPAPTRFEILLF